MIKWNFHENISRGKFVALLQLLEKFDRILQNHLLLLSGIHFILSKQYKTTFNIFACSIRESLINHAREILLLLQIR